MIFNISRHYPREDAKIASPHVSILDAQKRARVAPTGVHAGAAKRARVDGWATGPARLASTIDLE
jgi:hypothetical protein